MRRLGFGVLTMSMVVVACGRIVTKPNGTVGTGGVPSGNMLIRFRTQGPLNFTTFRYAVVFNTSGNGRQPYAPQIQDYTNYSFILAFGGTSITGTSYALFQLIPGASSGPTPLQFPISQQFVTSYNPNSSGQGNEFTFNFNRLLLETIPNPNSSATPVGTATPTASPTATPAGGATAVPTIAPGTSTLWNLNFFSTDTSNNAIDAISNLGVTDVSFQMQIDTTQSFDQVVTKPIPPPFPVQNPSSQVIQIEVINTP